MRMRPVFVCLLLALLAAPGHVLLAQTTGQETEKAATIDPQAALQRHVEEYLRYVFAWGPETQVNVGPLLRSVLPGVYSTLVRASQGESKSEEVFLVSADGRYIMRGDFFDTTADPFAEARTTIVTAGHPSKGAADAPVTIVEYSDFQCPTCAQMSPTLKNLLAERKDVRLVYKDLPLVRMHDWALAAAVAGQCAYQQSSDAFWQLHDYFFENQKQLTAQNLQARLDAFAPRTGLNIQQFRDCRARELTRARVEASLREADTLRAANTPTLFINGRRLTGNQPLEILNRLIAFELLLRRQGTAPKP